ncbi:MAG: CapA family protein [Byssovorax sp.]
MPRRWRALLGIALGLLPIALALGEGCRGDREPETTSGPIESATAPIESASAPIGSASAAPPASTAPARREQLVLLAGGDVSYARAAGKLLLDKPEATFFSRLEPWFSAADLRFANLEGPLSDQKGEVQSPTEPLVFTGPPGGADALKREGFDVVSTANNHAWDYGKKALLETLDNLDRVGVQHVGTGRDRTEAYRPLIVDKDGFRLAFLAVTDIWNQGLLHNHVGRDYVADADPDGLAAAVKAVRADPTVDAIAVSYHGGVEYTDAPIGRARQIHRMAIDAGADVVIGHHVHVIQGIEWYKGRPILYGLGNLLMRMNRDHPWTEMGFLARIVFHRGTTATLAACPYRIFGVEILPLATDPLREAYEKRFYDHLRAVSKYTGGTAIGPVDADGCAPITPEG